MRLCCICNKMLLQPGFCEKPEPKGDVAELPLFRAVQSQRSKPEAGVRPGLREGGLSQSVIGSKCG